MNSKRFFAAAAALALALATAAPALAAGEPPVPPLSDATEEDRAVQSVPGTAEEDGAAPVTSPLDAAGEEEVIAPPPCGGYATVITVNGKPLEEFSFSKSVPGWGSKEVTWKISDLDTVPTGYVPMRAIAQTDHGKAYWYQEENRSWFTLGGYHIDVYFNDMSIVVEEQPVEDASALLVNGTTYLPVSVIDGLEGCSVTDLSADGVERYEISTPNGTPMMKLAWQLQEMGPLAAGGKTSPETFEQFYGDATGFKAGYVTEFVAFTPMNTTPDTLIMGKPAEGKLEDIQTAMEAYRQTKEDTFSWYLGWNLPKVKDARFVTQGNWVLFYIGENADAVVEAFQAGVQGLE